jgi:hypothetical protein
LLHESAIVSQGRAPVPQGTPTKLADAITAGSHAAFMTGLHTTMVVAGFVALAGAAMGPLLKPRRSEQGDKDAGHEPVVTLDASDGSARPREALLPTDHGLSVDAGCPTGAE